MLENTTLATGAAPGADAAVDNSATIEVSGFVIFPVAAVGVDGLDVEK
jgi:hypothetical protein